MLACMYFLSLLGLLGGSTYFTWQEGPGGTGLLTHMGTGGHYIPNFTEYQVRRANALIFNYLFCAHPPFFMGGLLSKYNKNRGLAN